jgi:hypothetical protein
LRSVQVLRSPVDFDHALWFGWHVEVWQQGQLIDYGGRIEAHTEYAVTVYGSKYLKAVCEFRVR